MEKKKSTKQPRAKAAAPKAEPLAAPKAQPKPDRKPRGAKQAGTQQGGKQTTGKRAAPVRITLAGGRMVEAPRGMPAGELLEREQVVCDHRIVAVRYCNKVASLQRPLDKDGPLEPVHLGNRDGALIYRRSLTFLLIRAVAEVFPGMQVYINHSLDQGYYCELHNERYTPGSPVPLDKKDLRRIEARMREIAKADEPIERSEAPLDEALELFAAAGMAEKVELLKYSPADSRVSIYRMGGMINHFYGQLAPSTGSLTEFELRNTPPGFVLRFPSRTNPVELPPYQHQRTLFEVLQEYEQWMRLLDWRTVAQLNHLIDSGRVREYVLIAEALHDKKLAQIADMITRGPRHPRIVLLSGPSASGKTTSMKRLGIQLRVNGVQPVIIGLDDFFVDREKTPKDESGEFDFESFHAIDIERLQSTVRALLRGETVAMPKFDFVSGRSVPGEEMRLGDNQLLLLEGIHALNDGLLPTIPEGLKFKIYASPLTHLNIDEHNRISTRDARLLRRLVRDHSYRGYDAVETLRRWPSVRRGEERNIFPYQHNADVVFNSSLPYEISAMKQKAEKVLKSVARDQPEHSEAARLIKFLSYFREIPLEFVPRHSLLREFLGGSCFTY